MLSYHSELIFRILLRSTNVHPFQWLRALLTTYENQSQILARSWRPVPVSKTLRYPPISTPPLIEGQPVVAWSVVVLGPRKIPNNSNRNSDKIWVFLAKCYPRKFGLNLNPVTGPCQGPGGLDKNHGVRKLAMIHRQIIMCILGIRIKASWDNIRIKNWVKMVWINSQILGKLESDIRELGLS